MFNVSVIIFTYNQAKYICPAIEAALTQSVKPDFIMVVDDASSDGTYEIAKEWLEKRQDRVVELVRNEKNLGIVNSFARWVSLTKGDIIVPMAGDDISEPDRVSEVIRHFKRNPDSYALVASGLVIDGEGRLLGHYGNRVDREVSLSDIVCASGDFLGGLEASGAASAYRKLLITKFPKIRASAFAEDRIMCFRAVLLGSCHFTSAKHIRWRRHGANLSMGSWRDLNPQLSMHFMRCAEVVEQHLADLTSMGPDFLKRNQQLLDMLLRQKATYNLWIAASKRGIEFSDFISALKDLARCLPSLTHLIQYSYRPVLHLFTPYALRRQWRRLINILTK